MTSPDNKALIEEARSRRILSGAKEHVFNVANRLADALEASEAELARWNDPVWLGDYISRRGDWAGYPTAYERDLAARTTEAEFEADTLKSQLRKAVAAVALADADNPVIQALEAAQLQQTQARLEVVHQWAEMNPHSGVHDAPLEVRQALAYKGTGAKILKDRLRRASLQDNKEVVDD